jgi:hypothetical protein
MNIKLLVPRICGQAPRERCQLACGRLIAGLAMAAHFHRSIASRPLRPRSSVGAIYTRATPSWQVQRMPPSLRRWMRAWCLILPSTVLFASGCATVTVASSEGQITARGIFGTSIQRLALAPVSIRRQGIGVHQDRGSVTVGWLTESAVYEPSANNACRIVLFESNPAQLAELISVLRHAGADMTTVCSQPSGE